VADFKASSLRIELLKMELIGFMVLIEIRITRRIPFGLLPNAKTSKLLYPKDEQTPKKKWPFLMKNYATILKSSNAHTT